MNNSVFGKIMENLGKRVDVKLVTDEKQVLKLASKPIFVSSKIFNKNLIAVHKETLFLNRLAYVVVCILNLSKTLMYDFQYNYVKKYGSKARLFWLIQIRYAMRYKHKMFVMTSGQTKKNLILVITRKFHDVTNTKTTGEMKDETPCEIIKEFISLRSKMYSYIKDNNQNNKTAKGLNELWLRMTLNLTLQKYLVW